MRTLLSFRRSVLPTLFPPPNSRLLRSLEITATRARFASAAALQPWPYWNGTSNIGKKSDVVDISDNINGGRVDPDACTLIGLSTTSACRSARCALHRSTAER